MTDAKLAAGVLDADYFLGGRVPLHPELADQALRSLGEQLGLTPGELANGIIRLVNASIISALKLVSVRRGYDPRDFVLIAAGGGGPMHAAALGAELQVKRVVVPPHSGVFSAWGMGLTEARADSAQTRVIALAPATAAELQHVFELLEDEAASALTAEGIAPMDVRLERSADIRYRGQEHTVRVPVEPGPVSAERVEADFHAHHRQKYTFDLEGDPVEIVTCHVAAFGARPASAAVRPPAATAASSPSPKSCRRVDFDANGVREAPVYDRATLSRGFSRPGPVVVEDETPTALVHPGQTLEVDEAANLVIWL